MNSFTRIGLRSRFLLVLMIGLILPMLSVWGQNATITGKVVDPKGEPLVGVSVLEQGTTNGTVTDMNGRYSIVVQKDSSPLRFHSDRFLSRIKYKADCISCLKDVLP